ncbi:hypothetical protein ACOSP7_027030 [Xanthoceras sorbifolium]
MLHHLVGGQGFYEVLFTHEKSKGLPRDSTMIQNFQEALNACSLEDLGFRGPPFTWYNGRIGNSFVQERINRGVYNIEWLELFPGPLLIIWTIGCLTQGSRRFHFEECWGADERCEAIIDRNWCNHISGNSIASVLFNISACSKELHLWNKSNRVQFRQDISTKQ